MMVRRGEASAKIQITARKQRTGLSRNTVKRWLAAPEATVPKYRRQALPGANVSRTLASGARSRPICAINRRTLE
ncbi:hypothetical protein DNK49_21255 [Azoarcus communis]|uniref:Uncharacterized protein n=1 Tax=Parazoarcus communis SWub3 = DSM 12120 TaxID=1121029 RepID=A0A323US68_9RHOO|nr:hypothetical protein DNK49_21255 [Azoarcus communis] [Parazoarcus communis SWub3 = DSM 12120]